ncbi:MAG: heat-inducible transcriptional repressor HrcA [Anaerolineae bacterium]
MAEQLTPRQEKVLALVIRAFVESAQPVSSRAIVEESDLGVSPATVRGEMARLEELGYLTHPHTSAGRMPTDQGYRYFVQQLMGSVELPLAERRTIQHQFHQVRPDLDQWMRLSAAILARAGRGASLVTAPKTPASRFKHLELISTRETRVLLVLVLIGGSVLQQMLVLNEPAEQGWLSTSANRLNDKLHNLEASEIEALLPSLDPFDRQVASLVATTMERHDSFEMGQIYKAGVEEVLSQPEFATAERVRQVLHILEEHTLLPQILDEVLQAGGVQVLIGGEGRWHELSEISLVLSRYGRMEEAAGVLGLVGPMRMPYARAISAVQYVGGLLSDLLREFYFG